MKITEESINTYKTTLKAINNKVADDAATYIKNNNYDIDDGFVDYAYGMTTKYGEAAAELSCQMYDELHEAWKDATKSKKKILPAIPAETPTRSEVEKAVYGTLKTSVKEIPGAVARLVKRTAEDTKIQNGIRDRAEFAWIPSGDTCAFCLALASRGWQKISKKSLKNGHAEHIHANCDCTYAVRFDSTTEVEGYDPQVYRDMWDAADGKDSKAKMRSLRKSQQTDAPKVPRPGENALKDELAKLESEEKELFDKIRSVEVESYKYRRYDGISKEQMEDRLKAAEEKEKNLREAEQKARERLPKIEGMERPSRRDYTKGLDIDSEEYSKAMEKYREAVAKYDTAQEEYYNGWNHINSLMDSIRVAERETKALREIMGEWDNVELYRNLATERQRLNALRDRVDELTEKIYPEVSRASKILEANGIEKRPVEMFKKQPSMNEIIERVGGGDDTQGSCMSLAWTYIGNRNGIDVLDFRDGTSRTVFSRFGTTDAITQLEGVVSWKETGRNEITLGNKLLNQVNEEEKEYILVVGRHASVVRRSETGMLQYLELQSSGEGNYANGWHPFDNETLHWRFGARKSRTLGGSKIDSTAVLIDGDSLKGNIKFKNILEYLNTAPDKQRKSSHGTIK